MLQIILANLVLGEIFSKVKFSSIVNLIEGREIVPEFLQSKMEPQDIKNTLVELLDQKSKSRNQMLNDFTKVKEKLGKPGVYIKVANDILGATEK